MEKSGSNCDKLCKGKVMNFDVKKNYLIIANSSYESLLLKFRKNNPLINFKFISSSKFKKMFSFSYDKNIFFKFFNKLNLKDKKLNEYNYFSSFIRYIDLYKPSKSYDFSDFLKAKDYLMENNLILKQNYEVYINLLKNKDILLLNLDYDEEIKILLNNLNVNYTHINTKYLGSANNFDKKVLKFRTVFEQLDYVFNSICDTINSERALNKNSNIEKNIVYSGSKQNVKMTMINGNVVYRDGEFSIGESPEIIYQNAQRISERILR